jgi:hypothetical protein
MASSLVPHTPGTNEVSEFESTDLLYSDQSNSPLRGALLKIELAIIWLTAPPMPLSLEKISSPRFCNSLHIIVRRGVISYNKD